jgi:hypothetical protein
MVSGEASRQALLEREMGRLRVVLRLLSALLLALVARSLADGVSVASGLCVALVASLLLFGTALAGSLNSNRERDNDA